MIVEFPDTLPLIDLIKFAADHGCTIRFKKSGYHVAEPLKRSNVSVLRRKPSFDNNPTPPAAA